LATHARGVLSRFVVPCPRLKALPFDTAVSGVVTVFRDRVRPAETGSRLGDPFVSSTMTDWARENVPLLTGVLSVVALALVFGAVGGVIPSSFLPRASDTVLDAIPHLNAVISASAIITIVLGWRAISRGNVHRHRAFMLASFVLFAAFLVGYLYRLILVGTIEFPGRRPSTRSSTCRSSRSTSSSRSSVSRSSSTPSCWRRPARTRSCITPATHRSGWWVRCCG